MSINLLETVQQNLGYPPLQKIDPNTQQMVEDDSTPAEHKFSQAALPAILMGLYKYVMTDAGADEFLQGDNATNWLKNIFPDNKKEAIETISSYAKQSGDDPIAKLKAIITETIRVVKSNLAADAGAKEVKDFFSNQRNNILPYLPAALNMGELLNDSTMDDNTNKMEGPVSSLMHKIGSAFSKPVMDEEFKKA